MTEPLVEAYNDDQHGQVVEVLAEAYLTNPINVAVPGVPARSNGGRIARSSS